MKQLIYTSSVGVTLGKSNAGANNVNEDHPFPKDSLNAYVRTKREAEKAVLAANGESGLTTGAIRPGGMLELIVKCKLDRPYYVGEKGLFYPIVTSDDVAKVHLQLDKILVQNPSIAAGRVYIVATTISERELAKTVATELDDDQKAVSFSMSLYSLLTYFNVIGYWLTGTAPINPRMTLMVLKFMKLQSHSFSCARAQKELGWTPSPWKDRMKRLVKEWKSKAHAR